MTFIVVIVYDGRGKLSQCGIFGRQQTGINKNYLLQASHFGRIGERVGDTVDSKQEGTFFAKLSNLIDKISTATVWHNNCLMSLEICGKIHVSITRFFCLHERRKQNANG